MLEHVRISLCWQCREGRRRGTSNTHGGAHLVDKRGVGPPAEGVAVHDRAAVHHAARLLDFGHDALVCLLYVHARKVGYLCGEPARRVHRARHRLPLRHDAGLAAHAVVVLAKRGRLVHDAGAGVAGDVGVGDDSPRGGLILGLEVVE